MNDRLTELQRWLQQLEYSHFQLEAASEDASFRRYYRLSVGDESWIVMDAPPHLEPCDQFIAVARMLRQVGLSAPEIIQQDLAQGFLLISDFGTSDYLPMLKANSVDGLYRDAIAAILTMQSGIDASVLPPYDEAMLNREMDLFVDWFLQALLQIEFSAQQQADWLQVKSTLEHGALEQPQVFVHRDFHSRNLMTIAEGNPAIIDFQDAVKGPIAYDLVSLLRDCYIDWPLAQVEQWVADYHQQAKKRGLVNVELAEFMRWFNLIGIQRHLKVLGIFSRLSIRDGKDRYLADLPRTLNYIVQVAGSEPSMHALARLIKELDLVNRIKARVAS